MNYGSQNVHKIKHIDDARSILQRVVGWESSKKRAECVQSEL